MAKRNLASTILLFLTIISTACLLVTFNALAGSVEVSGYNDKGVYVSGELDVSSGGTVDGYLTTNNGQSIYVEGDIVSGGEVEISSDGWGGGGYSLDVD